MLTEAQRRELDSLGYTNAGCRFTPEELAEIASEYDRLVTPEAQTLGTPEQGLYPYRAMLNFRSDPLRRFVLHSALLSIAREVLGDDVRFWWDQGINKSPGARSLIAWHQDNGYTPGRIPEYLTCWLSLDASSQANGGLQVVPGSHRLGQREHQMDGAHAVIDPSDGELDVTGAVPLDSAAGDLLVFSSLLVHQTVGNTTADQQRRAWVIQYCRGDQRNEVTGEYYDNRAWVVRGGVPVTELRAERRFDLRADRP